MDILIITTYYPPDTAVAAVRPYMLSKYLTARGHKVTVLRSGDFYNSASEFFDMTIPVRVISFLGPDCPAERYARGELKEVPVVEGKSRIDFLPKALREPISRVFNACMRPVRFKRKQEAIAQRVELQKATLDNLRDEHFDVVFTTFSHQENIAAGQYAKKIFGCKLIQDYRDPLARRLFHTRSEYRVLKKIQDDSIRNADGLTAVTEGFRQELTKGLDVTTPNITLYNGYEPVAQGETYPVEAGVFSFCYTGILYGQHSDFTPLMKALQRLSKEGRIDLKKVRINYAGKDFIQLQEIAENLNMTDILVNHGYVSRGEASRLQQISDMFLVLSWNRKDSQGVMPGKFYEGIRAKRTILSLVSGDQPGSELHMINEMYGYGFCYEASRDKTHFDAFCDFLARCYEEKMTLGSVQQEINPALEARFRYDNIAAQLEDFIQSI